MAAASSCRRPLVQAPLVGSPAPDFTATSVFDQEFVETQLSSYKVLCILLKPRMPQCQAAAAG